MLSLMVCEACPNPRTRCKGLGSAKWRQALLSDEAAHVALCKTRGCEGRHVVVSDGEASHWPLQAARIL